MIDRLIAALAVVGGILLCTLTSLICLDVAVRYFQWFSLNWTLDVAEYHLYLITFCAAPWVLITGGHIGVDLLTQNISRAAARWLARVSSLIGAAVCLVLLFYAVKVLLASYTAGTLIYKALIMPEWPLFLLPPVTFALMLLVFLRWLKHPPVDGAVETDGL